MNFGGTLAKQKASFSLQVGARRRSRRPTSTWRSRAAPYRRRCSSERPRANRFLQGLFDYALTKDQTLRLSYNENENSSNNLGIGSYDLSERAFSNRNWNRNFRIQEVGPIGRRLFINTRLNVTLNHLEQQADVEAATIRVNDAFTSGGAQVAGQRLTRFVDLASDLDYVRGIQSVRGHRHQRQRWRTPI